MENNTLKEEINDILATMQYIEKCRVMIRPDNFTDNQWWDYKNMTEIVQNTVIKLEEIISIMA